MKKLALSGVALSLSALAIGIVGRLTLADADWLWGLLITGGVAGTVLCGYAFTTVSTTSELSNVGAYPGEMPASPPNTGQNTHPQ